MSEGDSAETAADETCLQCGETRAWAKVPGRICGIESGYEYRELEHEWPRHRWAGWTDKELSAFGVKPEAFEKHRRTDALTFQWIACEDTVRGHHPATADCVPDFASEIGQCITCGSPGPVASERTDLDGLAAAADPLVVRNGAIADALQPAGSTEDDLLDSEGLGLVGVDHASIVAHPEPTGLEQLTYRRHVLGEWLDSEPVHWIGDAPTSLHGNGASSFDRTTREAAEVTCAICRTLLARTEPDDSATTDG